MKKLIQTISAILLAFLACPRSYCEGAVEVDVNTLVKVTAYCPCEKCCGEFADGITASGHRIQKGDKFVAADPNIPFGTLLTIEGYAEGLPVPVLDRGGAIKGNRIDVFFDSHDEALKWGKRWLKVKVL